MSIHEMTESQKSEFLAAFRTKFGFGELTASASADAHAMLNAAAWAWQASREALVIELPRRATIAASDSPHEIFDLCAECIAEVGVTCK